MASIGQNIVAWFSDALYWLPAVVISLSFHECAHAFVAYRCGDPTARNLGRMTLNPIKHIDPIGFVMMLLVHFGWAKPVPVNYRNFNKPKRDIILVSVAGITANLLLAFITFGIWFALTVNAAGNVAVQKLLIYFYMLNLNLVIFNLIPVFPLDGYRILKELLPYKASLSKFVFYLERYGNWILIALLLSNIVSTVMQYATSGITVGFTWFYSAIFGLFGGA